MKKILLALALCGLATASWAQWEPLNGIIPKKPQLILPENMGTRGTLGTATPAYLPHKGSPRILTILVNYADSAFSVNNPKEAFNDFFSATSTPTDLGNANMLNKAGVAQYFKDMSNGAFTPVFDIYGPVTVANNMTYYGGTKADGSDENADALVSDALKLITDSVKDVSIYDCNNDDYIDCVYIVYAGPGQNFSGGDNTVWAKTSQISGTFKDKKLGWYSMAGELLNARVKQVVSSQPNNNSNVINSIGVTCHELSHAMGLPDIYPTATSARVDNQEMEYWDLMDGGEYTYNGWYPTAYTAWEKNLMGWDIDIQTINDTQEISFDQSTEEGGIAYKIVNPAESNEYFLLENIQKKLWNQYIPGHGLLVYHVNEAGYKTIGVGTHLNNTKGKPGMAVVPADGECLSSYTTANDAYVKNHKGDPFPGTSNVTCLNDTLGLPNFWWYTSSNENATTASSNGTTYKKVNMALKDITEENGVISFSFISDFATGIRNINADRKSDDSRIFSLDGRYLGNNLYALPHGIYIRGGRKIVK